MADKKLFDTDSLPSLNDAETEGAVFALTTPLKTWNLPAAKLNEAIEENIEEACSSVNDHPNFTVYKGDHQFSPANGISVDVKWTRYGASISIYVSVSITGTSLPGSSLELFTWEELDIPGFNDDGRFAHPLTGTMTFVPALSVNGANNSNSYLTGSGFETTDEAVSWVSASPFNDTTARLTYHNVFNDCSAFDEEE